jgi:aspartokinase/homoserine dehydrogenase 1
VLRYIGRIKDGKCAIELRAVEKNSPFGNLIGGDNMVVFTTKRYFKNPLIVRGPGAGPEVTAGGVFADILKVANLLTS